MQTNKSRLVLAAGSWSRAHRGRLLLLLLRRRLAVLAVLAVLLSMLALPALAALPLALLPLGLPVLSLLLLRRRQLASQLRGVPDVACACVKPLKLC